MVVLVHFWPAFSTSVKVKERNETSRVMNRPASLLNLDPIFFAISSPISRAIQTWVWSNKSICVCACCCLPSAVEAGTIQARMQMPPCQGKHFGWRSSSVYPHYQVNLFMGKKRKKKGKQKLGQIIGCISGVFLNTIQRTPGVKLPMQQADSRQQPSAVVNMYEDRQQAYKASYQG